jgi:hypothetical protein
MTLTRPETEQPKLLNRSDVKATWHVWAAFLIVVVVQTWVTLSHDSWLDEWQATMIAIQSPSLSALTQNLRYEGHPPFWYLVLRGAGYVASPEWAMKGAALLVALSTATIIMWRAPFTVIERVLICLGYFLLIEYGSLSRGIGLGVMLMFLFVATQSKNVRWAILILFPMIEVQFAVLSIAGAAMTIRDRQWSWPGAALLAISMVAMVALVWPAPDIHMAVDLRPVFWARAVIFFMMFGNLMVPIPFIDGQINWFGNAPGLGGLLFAALFVILGVKETRADRWHLLVFTGFLGFTIFMALFVYTLSMRHVGLVAALLLVLAWRSAEAGTKPSIYLRTWMAIGALCGLFMAVHISRVGFDNSGKAARYIEAHKLQNKLWVSYDDPHAVPVTARLGIPNYNLTKQCLQTFIRWDRKGHQWTVKTLDAALRQTADAYGEFYLVSKIRFEEDPDASGILQIAKPLAAFGQAYTGRGFNLYHIAGGVARTGRVAPMCKPLGSAD